MFSRECKDMRCCNKMIYKPAKYKHAKTYVSFLIVLSTFVYTLGECTYLYTPAVIYAYVAYVLNLVSTPTF